MAKIQPPPIQDPVIDEDGYLVPSWTLFFNQVYVGDTGTTWTPTFSGLGTTGTPTITGKYYKLSQSLVYFSVRIVPGTDTTSTASTTYIDNFPLRLRQDGACAAVGGTLGVGLGIALSGSNRIYTPAWSAVTVPVTVVGLVEAT